jgi:uncharacterized protein
MTNFIPIFPLSIVVFPGEHLNLHIFEPRYRQLITDCFEAKKPFGIPTVLENKVSEMGTLVNIVEISKTYDKGEMDIRTDGLQTFKILEIVKDIPEKLYSGAIVTYPKVSVKGSAPLMKKVLKSIRDIHASLGVENDFKKPDEQLLSYDVAHHAGMSLQDEYYLLELGEELHRQEFLKRHLLKVSPVMEEMELLKNKIKLNGHFKNLEGFQF